LLRIPESPDAIGVAKQYKIVTCGEAIADVTAFSFTTHGLSYARPCPATVLSATTTAPPSGALDGDSYLLPNDTSLAGAWETHGGEIATWSDETDSWVFCLPAPGTVVHISEGESSGGGGDDVISGGDGTYTPSAWPPRTASYVTVNDETATLPNSVRVVAGDNITFVVDSTNALTISATGGDSSSGGDGNITPDTHPASPNAADDEFEYGSSIDTTGARFTGATAWASANLGSVSNSVTRGSLALTLPTEATGQFRGYEQTVSGGSWRYECKLSHALSLGANTALQGFGIRENGTGKMLQFYRVYTGGLMQFSVSSWTSFSAFSATLAGGNISDLFSFAGWLYVAIDYDGTDYRFETSENGVVWLRHASAAKATYFTTAADRVMVSLFNGNSGQTANGAWDWVRRVS
jgi:plastocyanin